METQKVQGWPIDPRILKKRSRWYITTGGMLIIPFLFVVLSIAVLCLRGQAAPSKYGAAIQELSEIGSTVYPIVFTSLVSSAFQSAGQLYSERGIKLMNLHILITTGTTHDAVRALKRITRLPPIIIPCILVWALSPLGSQASLRILDTSYQTRNTTSTARYLDTGPMRHYWISWVLERISSHRSLYDRLADAELLTAIWQTKSTLDSPMDLWGNAKIPWINLESNSNNTDNWVQTSSLMGADSYSSLIGLPIHDLPPSGITELSVETSYLSFSCSPLSIMETLDDIPRIRSNIRLSCPGCPKWNRAPSEACSANTQISQCSRLASFLGLSDHYSNGSADLVPPTANTVIVELRPGPGQYEAISQIGTQMKYGWSTRCDVKEKHVEVLIKCENGNCRSEAIRPSQLDTRPPNLTAFDYWATQVLPNEELLPIYEPGPVMYLSRGSNQSELEPIDLETAFSHVTEELFSMRIGAIINTYLQIWLSLMQVRPLTTFGFQRLTGLEGTEPWGPGYIPANGLKLHTQSSDSWQTIIEKPDEFLAGRKELYWYAEANITTSFSEEVYRPVAIWVTVLLFCSVVIACIGIFGIVCKSKSLAPNRFDAVLGHTFDNPDFGLDSGGTTLGVDERLRLLGHLEVRVGDVRKAWDVGRIGFAMKNNASALQLGRSYE